MPSTINNLTSPVDKKNSTKDEKENAEEN